MRPVGTIRFRLFHPLRVFVAGCVIAGAIAGGYEAWVRMSTRQRLADDAANLEAKINARVAAYEALLRGLAGFFATSGWVTHAEFDRYIQQLDLAQNYAGIRGIGLSLRLAPDEVPAFEHKAQERGLVGFRVWPEGRRPEYHTVLYLEPEDARNRAAVGFDMHTDPTRRAAMDLARDSARPTVSGKVTLVQEIDASKQAGFLIYVPYYRAGEQPTAQERRRADLAGFAYAAFRVGDFLHALIDVRGLHDASVSVYDGLATDDASLLFRSGSLPLHRGLDAIIQTHVLRVLERPWTLVYSAVPRGPVSPFSLLAAGLLLSAAAALVSRAVERTRRRAEQSEAATRAREGELALLVDAVPALVTYLDVNGTVRFVNRRLRDWFGLDERAILGRQAVDLTDAEGRAAVAENLRRALGGEGVTSERWYRTAANGARFLQTMYVPHRAPDGTVSGVYALTSDLTEHKRAEEAARFVADCGKLFIASLDFEATTRAVVPLAVPRIADVAILFQVEGDDLQACAVAHVDERLARELSGFLEHVRLPVAAEHNIALAARTRQVVVSSRLDPTELDRAAADDAQRRMLRALQLQSALHVPVTVRGRVWGIYSFGTTAASARQFTDEHRQLADEISTRAQLAVENALLYREAQQEIEERVRAERVARETEERFRLLVSGVRDYAILALDADGRIASWNEGAEDIFGYPAQDVLGREPDLLYTVEDRRRGLPAANREEARTRGAASDERWFQRKDATPFWASSHMVVLRDEGAVRGFTWILRDLTERKRTEDELERRVQVRTAELNDAVQELESFSYSVSHDLRAPLRTIRGFTEMTLDEAGERLTGDERNYLDRVRRAAARLERLIGDLLAYTRVSKTKVELRPVDLQALVSDLQREHPELQPPQSDVRIEGPLLPVVGNEAYLTQCLTNLLGNAVKFVPEGRLPIVCIWTERRGGSVRLYVADNGIGIAPEGLNKAFGMFERLHTTGNFEGTGVGLAIVRRAVHRMRGEVGVTSKLGEGSTFWIELPVA